MAPSTSEKRISEHPNDRGPSPHLLRPESVTEQPPDRIDTGVSGTHVIDGDHQVDSAKSAGAPGDRRGNEKGQS